MGLRGATGGSRVRVAGREGGGVGAPFWDLVREGSGGGGRGLSTAATGWLCCRSE
jgi:hypothetical protein